jgi:hypothetical protein
MEVFMFRRITAGILTCLLFSVSNGFAAPVSRETAEKLAANWMSQITGHERQSVEAISDKQVAKVNGETVLAEDNPAYYIVNIDGGGWGIIAGDDAVNVPVIGYSTTGSIDLSNLPPAFLWWMEEAKGQVEAAASVPVSKTTASSSWQNLNAANYGVTGDGTSAVAPLLTTKWSQGKYYNSKCPVDSAGPDGHALVGCCATAFGQVMKYHNWPVTGNGSNSYTHSKYGTISANFGATSYNWSSMPSSGSLTSYNDATATLLYHAGVAVNMDYGPDGSGCNSSKIADAFSQYFRYKQTALQWKSNFTDTEWKSKIITDLNASRPVLYRGSDVDGKGGHAFVCDGFSGTDYFHFNWGWNGSSDGYFYLTALTAGSYNFINYQAAIFGIEPDVDKNPPTAATLVSPSGSITSTKPTFTWNAVSGATWYALYVKNDSTNKVEVNTTWYQGSSLCSGSTCSMASPATLGGGNHSWWVRTWNSYGYGPWSNSMSFNTPGPPPAATLISPSGETSSTKPTFTWNAVSGATWYALYVYNDTTSKTEVGTTWYQSSSVCSGSTCSVTSPATLGGGEHRWWIRTYNSSGYGPWSDFMSFKTPGGPPAQATLVSPAGEVTSTKPTFTWNAVSEATWYALYVYNDSSGTTEVNTKWYQSSSVCSGSTCSVTSPATLGGGKHRWWIRTYNSSGYGPWSDSMAFELSDNCHPGTLTLIAPSDTITDSMPTFTWSKDAASSWYYLYLRNSSTGRLSTLNGWKQASDVCASTDCSVTPSTSLEPGAYSWWVRPYSSCGGYGDWSGPQYFELGFNSQFNGNAANWYYASGYAPWYLYSNYYMYTPGSPNSWATTYYGTYLGEDTKYSDFDYEVKMFDTGGDYSTGIALRGDPLMATNGYWTSGYQFTYLRDRGLFSVWQMQGDTATNLVAWQENSAINKGSAWNTLRVRAVGSTIDFYINGTKVATLTNASITSGKVGLMTYRSDDNGYLYVDYAKLTPISSARAQQNAVSRTSDNSNVIVVDAAAVDRSKAVKGSPISPDIELNSWNRVSNESAEPQLVPGTSIGKPPTM